jgi:hypothetical protein
LPPFPLDFPVTDRRPDPAPAANARRPLLPPHVAWPLFVVLLLLTSITAAAVTVAAALSDGGAQVVAGSDYAPNEAE